MLLGKKEATRLGQDTHVVRRNILLITPITAGVVSITESSALSGWQFHVVRLFTGLYTKIAAFSVAIGGIF